jgi:hypothetical protein
MRTKQLADHLPLVPSSFFLSLLPEQQQQLKLFLHALKLHYASYYSFSGEMIKKNIFIANMWENRLYNEVLKPTLITKNMFRTLLVIWFMQHAPKYKNTRLTRDIIKEQCKTMGKIYRLDAFRMLRFLSKFDWVGFYLLRHKKQVFFVSEKGLSLITAYSLRYQELFNDFFEPLSL